MNEVLTPTEKLKALREIAKLLTGGLGKVVTFDDETTNALLSEAEHHAVVMLKTIHDCDSEDIAQAIENHNHPSERGDTRFEHSVDALIARREHLTEAHRALINPRTDVTDASYAILMSQANDINRQIADIDDAINNLYTLREFGSSA